MLLRLLTEILPSYQVLAERSRHGRFSSSPNSAKSASLAPCWVRLSHEGQVVQAGCDFVAACMQAHFAWHMPPSSTKSICAL
uniref:Uncharacterized protein n=1 Tax=Tanacetum cinerariifolium TaxID=118510 RepID=A0A699XFL3_TANCI|nr:hypothetical protein [Tanacetum cinerariifolium]